MTADQYRDIAIKLAAQRHMTIKSYVLRCKGCGRTITATNSSRWFSQLGEAAANHRLAERAVKLGWRLDDAHSICCAACAARLGIA